MVRPQQQEVPYSRSDDVDDYNYNGRRYLFGADDEYDQEKEEDTITPNDKDDITNDVDDKDNDWWRLDDDEEGPNLPTKVGGEEEEGWWKLFGSSLSFSSLDPHDSLVGSFFFDKQPQQPKWNGSKAHPRHHHHHRGRLLNTDDGWNALDWTWSYHDLFHSVVFLLAAYVGGKIVGGTSSGRRRRQRSRGVTAASTSTKSSSFVCRDWIPAIPSWVGHVLVGLVLGPPLANWVPSPESFVLLGEIGLILMMIEAGMNVDISLFRFVGTRGILLAWVGAMIPMALGIVLATIVLGSNGGDRAVAAIAAGAAFGPTSVRLVQQSLDQAQFANTPVGHLIVTAAVLEELMALVLLSELPAFARATADTEGSWSVWSLLFPMMTSRLFLVLGMCLVVLYIPPILQTRVYPHLTKSTTTTMGRMNRTTTTTPSGTPKSSTSSANVGKLELALLLGLALLLMEGAHYFHVSHLMACYLAGMAFCTSPTLQVEWMRQLQRVLQWLSRLLFAATIAFPLGPFSSASSSATPVSSATQVLFQGLILSFAWTGKVAVAFLVLPNSLSHTSPTLPPYTGLHLRDCLVTGWSLACQGELALIVAVTARAHDLVDGTLYASIVVAVVLSSIVPPLVLNRILRYYNHTTHKELVQLLAQAELERRHDLDHPLLYPSSASGSSGGRARRAQRMAALHGHSQQQRRGGGGGMTHSPQEEDIAVLIDLLSISQRDNPIANTGAITSSGGPDWMSTSSSTVPSRGGPGVPPPTTTTTTSLRQQSIVFLVIQTQVEGQWGLLQLQMLTLAKQGLDVIDHRLWHCPPRQRHRCQQAGLLTIRQSGAVDATKWMSEVYVKAILTKSPHDGLTAMEALEQRILEIREALTASLSQPEEEGGVPAKVHVQRWYPGIVEEVLETTTHSNNNTTSNTLVEGGSESDFVGLSHKPKRNPDIKWYLTLDESVHKQVVANGVLNERQIQEILESLPALHPDNQDQQVRTSTAGPDAPPPTTTTTTTSPSEDPGLTSRSETDSSLGQPPAPAPASSTSSLPQPSQPVQDYNDDMAPSSSAPYSQQQQQPQRRQRSPVIGGGLFRGDTATQQRMGTGGIGSSGQQRLEQIMGHRIAISVENNTETFHGRMATKDWRKLQKAYNTNPRLLDQDFGSEQETGNGDDDDSEFNYNISYGGGGLNQDVVDLYMQPNLPDVTELLCGYVRVDTPVLTMPYPEYDQPPTQQQQPYSDGLSASQLSSAAVAGANAVLSWGGRGRNRDGTSSESNNTATGQSWGDAVRNKARQLRQGGARAMGMTGATGGNYSPVGQQDPMSMLPQPPQRLDSGGDDIVEQAMELLHVPPDARRAANSSSPMPTKMLDDAYSTHFEIGDVEDPNAPVPSQPQPSYHSYPPTATTTTKIHSSRHPEEEIEFTSSS